MTILIGFRSCTIIGRKAAWWRAGLPIIDLILPTSLVKNLSTSTNDNVLMFAYLGFEVFKVFITSHC